jgi:hypothetical protein
LASGICPRGAPGAPPDAGGRSAASAGGVTSGSSSFPRLPLLEKRDQSYMTNLPVDPAALVTRGSRPV